MIGYLRGILMERSLGDILLDVNGVGYNVFLSESDLEELPNIGDELSLYTYMSVRDDGIFLYGFLNKESKDMFLRLIGVNSVGPKGALSILSTFSVPDLIYAILMEDSNTISKAPTIGKKTAERIILDLKDKFSKDDLLANESAANPNSDDSFNYTSEIKDAIDALMALGYDRKSSEHAVKSVENGKYLTANEILKDALHYLY